MKQETVVRDERYTAVENASYRVGYLLMTFGTLALCVVRSALYQQSNWDFFGLVILSAMAATVYQIKKKILPYTMKTLVLLVVLVPVTAAAAALAVFFLQKILVK